MYALKLALTSIRRGWPFQLCDYLIWKFKHPGRKRRPHAGPQNSCLLGCSHVQKWGYFGGTCLPRFSKRLIVKLSLEVWSNLPGSAFKSTTSEHKYSTSFEDEGRNHSRHTHIYAFIFCERLWAYFTS